MSLSRLSKSEVEELRRLWFDECLGVLELCRRFCVYSETINRYVKTFKISDEEFLQKEAEIAEILSIARGRKSIIKLATRRRERLRRAYANSQRPLV